MTKFNNQELQAIGKDSQVIYLLQIKWNDQNNEKKKIEQKNKRIS